MGGEGTCEFVVDLFGVVVELADSLGSLVVEVGLDFVHALVVGGKSGGGFGFVRGEFGIEFFVGRFELMLEFVLES